MLSYGAHCSITGTGPSVILLHDLMGPELDYDSLSKLLDKHMRLFQLTLPGYLKGDPLFSASPFHYVQWIEELTQKFDINSFNCIGIGMGGNIALELAARNPDQIKKLTLLHPWGIQRPSHLPVYARSKPLFKQFIHTPDLYQAWMNRFEACLSQDCPEYQVLSDKLMDIAFDPQRQTQIQTVFPEMMYPNREMRRTLHRIHSEVQILWGEDAPWISKQAGLYLESKLQTVKLEILEKCGYFCHIERPNVVARHMIQFIKKDTQRI